MACLKKLAKQKPKEVVIASFNVYAGILHDGDDCHEWGGKYRNNVHELLDSLADAKVSLLVGIPLFRPCKPACEECLEAHCKQANKLVKHSEKWPHFDWRFTESFHLKCCIFYYSKGSIGVTGGRNLTDSSWTDMSMVMNEKQTAQARKLFNQMWAKSKEVTQENIDAIIEDEVYR